MRGIRLAFLSPAFFTQRLDSVEFRNRFNGDITFVRIMFHLLPKYIV